MTLMRSIPVVLWKGILKRNLEQEFIVITSQALLVVRTVGVLVKGPTKVIDPFRIKWIIPTYPYRQVTFGKTNFWILGIPVMAETLHQLIYNSLSQYLLEFFDLDVWKRFQPSTVGYLCKSPLTLLRQEASLMAVYKKAMRAWGCLACSWVNFFWPSKKVSMLLGWIFLGESWVWVNPATWSFPQKIPCWGLKIPWHWSLDLVQSHSQKRKVAPKAKGKGKRR